MSKVIFIVGPTATGKTEVAFSLAKKIKAQIVSCDSMLVYREPHIITSKPSESILKEVKHHFVNIVSVSVEYDVFKFYKSALSLIEDLVSKNIPVIVCGGTGLYMKAILDGIFESGEPNESLRLELANRARADGPQGLYQELLDIDPDTALKVSPNDVKRIIRALEVYHTTGVKLSEKKQEAVGLWGKLPIKIFGLEMPRDKLYEKINARTELMFEQGAVAEVKKISAMDLSKTAEKIIGIEQIRPAIMGDYSIEKAKEIMSQHTRNYAKRQFTWFRKDSRVEWIDVDKRTADDVAEEILKK